MFLYWLESAIIGVFTVLKMLRTEGNLVSNESIKMTINGETVKAPQANPFSAKLFYVPFFTIHYGLFMIVHLVFLLAFFGSTLFTLNSSGSLDFGGVLVGFLSLVFSHAMSYRINFIGKGEYKVLNASQLMMSPYPRIIVMYLTVLFGGFFAMFSGQSVTALALLVILKTAVDIASHSFEHGQIAKRLL